MFIDFSNCFFYDITQFLIHLRNDRNHEPVTNSQNSNRLFQCIRIDAFLFTPPAFYLKLDETDRGKRNIHIMDTYRIYCHVMSYAYRSNFYDIELK